MWGSVESRVRLARASLEAAAAVRALVESGQAPEGWQWVAIKGAQRYVEAVAAGDVATEQQVVARLGTCNQCKWRTVSQVPGTDAPSSWCGPALVDRSGEPEPTCGCPLAAMVQVGTPHCLQKKHDDPGANPQL